MEKPANLLEDNFNIQNENRDFNNIIEDEYSKKIINDIFGQEYFDIETKLKSIKEYSKSYFTNISLDYSNKCQQLINDYKTYFSKIIQKIQNSFELKSQATGEEIIDDKKLSLIKKYSKKYLDSFNSILTMNEQIFDNIKQNMNILINFIDITSKSIDKENPTHIFLDKIIMI